MKPTLNLGNSVCANGKLGIIVQEDENIVVEQEVFEVWFSDGKTEHLPESKLTPDLFEHPECIPQEVKEVIDSFSEKAEDGMSYDDCASLVQCLEAVGYTCEYYLDAEPFFLRKKDIVLVD